ncbi:MAG: formylmethanofuran dehydrogenase [Desulfofustis sp.]|nr:formylmethanofuran dehydrogenase [Desulfofustis sp.]
MSRRSRDLTLQDRQRFEKLLAESVALHGHLCAGQVIGVRMSLLGLQLLGIADPKGADRRKLYVVVEVDRCATDAIQSVTGCSLGKRSLRWVDLGIMAATFADLEHERAVRITAREESRTQAQQYRPDIVDKYQRQLAAYQEMPDDLLFRVQQVRLQIAQNDLPGRPLRRVCCQQCGDWVQDGRDELIEGQTLCRSCAHGAYYTLVSTSP